MRGVRMKCGYKHCKSDTEVKKDNSLFYKNRYYHEECLEKRICKEKCLDLFKSKNLIVKSSNIYLHNAIDKEDTDCEYLLFTVERVVNNDMRLTSAFGIKNYLQSYKNLREYEKHKKTISSEQAKKIKNFETVEDATFTYNKKHRDYTKLI